MGYRSLPENHGLTTAQGDAIYEFYVEQKKTMVDTQRATEAKLDCSLKANVVSRFINANGWKRSQRYYARRSPWKGRNAASVAESEARRRESD